MKKIPLLCLALALSGCPWRVTPTTEAQCSSRPNCGQCASEAVCAWDIDLSQCRGVSEVSSESNTASATEQCPSP